MCRIVGSRGYLCHSNPLCPDPAMWRIAAIARARDRLVLHLEPLRRPVACPVCGTRSRCVHRRYRRKPQDFPWGRRPVQLIVHARRPSWSLL